MEAHRPNKSSSFIVSDPLITSFDGWLRKDLKDSFNFASLALWRAEHHNLWLSAEEELYLNTALLHPPVTRKARRKG